MPFGVKMERKVEDTQPLPLDNLNSYSHVKEKKKSNQQNNSLCST